MNSLLIKNVVLGKKIKDIYIKNRKIEKIAPKINKKAAQKIDGEAQKAILPGLINAHTHAAMSLFRGYADDLPLKQWLEQKIWPLEAKLTQEDIYWGTKLAILEMIKTGTTCFNDMYWMPSATIQAVEEMGIRAVIGLTLLDFLPMGQKESIEKNWQSFKKKKLKTTVFSIAPHSIYTVSRENLIWAKKFAVKNKLILHIHLSETEKEVKDCLKAHKIRPVEYLDKIGLLNKNCILAHSVWLSNKEIKILNNRACSVVHCPCSNMKLSSGIFPYSKVQKAGVNPVRDKTPKVSDGCHRQPISNGVNICLGTDGASSNNNLDLFEEMKFASLLAKVNEMSLIAAPAAEILEVATKNSAKALKIPAGEIKQGKLADLILVDLNQACLTPGHNLISDLVYSANGSCVTDVICHGKILMRNKKIPNEQQILKQATKRAKALAS